MKGRLCELVHILAGGVSLALASYSSRADVSAHLTHVCLCPGVIPISPTRPFIITELPLLWDRSRNVVVTPRLNWLSVSWLQLLSRRWVALSPYIFPSSGTGCPHPSANAGAGGGSSPWDGSCLFLWPPPHSYSYRMSGVSPTEFRAPNELWEHPAAPSRTSCRIISSSTFFLASSSFQ